MKPFLLAILICLIMSCKKTGNCVKDFVIKRTYDAPAPDNITFKAQLSKEYQNKISDSFCHINFYIDDEKLFTTHDVILYNEKDICRFSIRTTNFIKQNLKEVDFYKLINSTKSLKVELVYDDTGEIFTFTKCR